MKLKPKNLKYGQCKTQNTPFQVIISGETDPTNLKTWHWQITYANGLIPNLKFCQETVILTTKIQFLLCGTLLHFVKRPVQTKFVLGIEELTILALYLYKMIILYYSQPKSRCPAECIGTFKQYVHENGTPPKEGMYHRLFCTLFPSEPGAKRGGGGGGGSKAWISRKHRISRIFTSDFSTSAFSNYAYTRISDVFVAWQQAGCIMADITKARLNNPNVKNFSNVVEHTL